MKRNRLHHEVTRRVVSTSNENTNKDMVAFILVDDNDVETLNNLILLTNKSVDNIYSWALKLYYDELKKDARMTGGIIDD